MLPKSVSLFVLTRLYEKGSCLGVQSSKRTELPTCHEKGVYTILPLHDIAIIYIVWHLLQYRMVGGNTILGEVQSSKRIE